MQEGEVINDYSFKRQNDYRATRRLWRALRERAEQSQAYGVSEADLPPEVLTTLLGIKDAAESYETNR